MTHDILPADVDLANKLRNAGHSDEEVITTLVHRGIDRGDATQLLDDLRNGRPIKTKAQHGLETSLLRRSRERRSGSHGERRTERKSEDAGSAPSPEPRHESHGSESAREQPKPRKRKFKFWPWMVIGLVCVSVAFATLLIFNHGQLVKGGSWSNRFATPASAREVAGNELNTGGTSGLRLPPDELAFEFRPAGLHLGGVNLTRDNALKVISDFLGQPTRSIPGKAAGTVNYAFDDYGLVICAEKNGANHSILLDCDAVGGATGTRAGFKGSLRADSGEMIRPDTHSRTLAAIKSPRLNHSTADAGILDGRFNDLALVFVYLKSADRLSAIEIDFK
jgi:hypothetical protein